MIVRAKYLLDRKFTVRDNVAVRIRDGAIVELADDLTGEEVLDLGDALLMPGLVNAHTHLELGYAAGKVAPSADFVDWLRRLLVEIRSTGTDDDTVAASVRAGLRASIEAGVTLLGDISRAPDRVRPVLAAEMDRPAVVSFGEVLAFGTILANADAQVISAFDTRFVRDDLRVGVSPHATYSVEEAVLDACIRHAHKQDAPVCIHTAEAREEERYLRDGDGPLRDYFVELGLWDSSMTPIGCRPLEYIERNGALHPTTLLAHGNYLSDDEIERVANAGSSVAYCPRTHHAFGHDPHPFRRMLDAGVNVCLGTDSLASNPDLSVLEEMRFVHRTHPSLDPRKIMAMGTKAGAQALGMAEIAGELRPGARADLIAIPLDPTGPTQPLDNVLENNSQPRLTLAAGKRLFG